MATFKVKRNKIRFYLTLSLLTLISIGIGTFIFYIFLEESKSGNSESGKTILPVFTIIFYLFPIYTWYRYLKNTPIIQVDQLFISFNDETFLISEIQKIKLSGKQDFPYLLLGFPMESISLKFKSGQVKYIFDDLYENSSQLKLFLKQELSPNKSDKLIPVAQIVNHSIFDYESFQTYKGNQITSLRGISLWLLPFIFVMIEIENGISPSFKAELFVFIFLIIWFLIHSWMMHYFKVSNSYLVIKNHNLIWKTKAYNLSDIEEIVFETQRKMPNMMRVITKDYHYKLYPAGTLRDKTWLDLQSAFKSRNIKVRNECI